MSSVTTNSCTALRSPSSSADRRKSIVSSSLIALVKQSVYRAPLFQRQTTPIYHTSRRQRKSKHSPIARLCAKRESKVGTNNRAEQCEAAIDGWKKLC